MKKSNLLLNLLLAVTMIFSVTACKEDEPDIPTGGDGIPVADGMYITQDGVDPVPNSQLFIEMVEDGLSSKERADFYGNYVYLTSGSYVLVEIEAKAIKASYGGTASSATTDDADQCEALTYNVVALEMDGNSFAVSESGLYKVAYDMEVSEISLVKVSTVGLIGDGTEVGWAGSSNLVMDGSFDGAAGTGAWTKTGVTLRSGNLKIRFDCTWAIDRPEYSFYTNFGAQTATPVNGDGTVNLAQGNDEGAIPISGVDGAFPNEGVYTVDVTWEDGEFTVKLTRTGDAEEITFDPTDYEWGIIGDATQGTTGDGGTDGWGDHKRMFYSKDGVQHRWRGVFPLEAADAVADPAINGEFKFRADGSWSNKITSGSQGVSVTITDNTESGSISNNGDVNDDGSWFVDANPGFYYFEITTSDNGETWTLLMDEAEFQLIGEGSPVGNWDAGNGQAMTYNDDLSSATGSGAFTTAGWKFFVNQSFDYNLGGTLDGTTALLYNDAVANVSADGTYNVTISTTDGGQTYVAVAAQ